MLRLAMYCCIGLVVIYACAGIVVYRYQRSLLYFNTLSDAEPASIGLPEAVVRRLKTADGETLVSWFVRRPGQYVALYFHGNGGALSVSGDRITQLAEMGFSVLAVDYRGYGGSTGEPTETGLHLDADATYDEAMRLGFGPDHIILLGESLGSGVALELASRRQVAGIALDSPYSSVVDVAAERYWIFPVRWLMADQYRSDLWIPKVHVPILILHGTSDWVVPIKYGRRLAGLGGANVTFVAIEKAGHVVFDEPAAEAPTRQWLKKFGISAG
jgi:pimeloyl-ACP methyl ester carboxylesterase